jgi:putative hydrolase of the HAD superfamily
MTTRAVVFDVDGVLLHGFHARPDQRENWDRSLAPFGIDPDRFQSEFIFDIFMKKVLIGEMPMIEALDKRLPGLGYRGSPMHFADHWLTFDNRPNTELLDLVRTLKSHADVRLYLATNQDHMRAQWLWQTFGLDALFEDMFYSARIGMTKAHKSFFAFADARMPKCTQPPLFFDDTQKVIDVALSAGWEAVHYNDITDVARHPWVNERL